MRYEVRWEDGIETKSSSHESEKSAKAKGREMSEAKKFRLAIVAEIDEEAGAILRKWTYENGKQTDSHLDPEETAETTKEAESEGDNIEGVKTDDLKEPETKTKTSGKKRNKKEKVEPDVEVGAESKEETHGDIEMAMSDKSTKILEQCDFRKDSIRAKFARALLANMNKQLSASQLGRATFGSAWTEKKRPKLNAAAAYVRHVMKKEKTGLDVVIEKNDKGESTYGIRAK